MNHHAPNLKIVGVINLEDGIFLIGRAQFDISFVSVRQVEILHREAFRPHPCQHNRTIMRFHSPVDNHAVTVEDARFYHRIPLHFTIERGFRMLDVIPVEVQRLVPVIVSRRWESRHDTCSFQFQLGVKHTSYYLDIAHTFPNPTLTPLNNFS